MTWRHRLCHFHKNLTMLLFLVPSKKCSVRTVLHLKKGKDRICCCLHVMAFQHPHPKRFFTNKEMCLLLIEQKHWLFYIIIVQCFNTQSWLSHASWWLKLSDMCVSFPSLLCITSYIWMNIHCWRYYCHFNTSDFIHKADTLTDIVS